MKNKLSDLNNHLFAQMERLQNEEMNGDDLRTEIERAKSVAMISNQIVSNARLVLDAQIRKPDMLDKTDLPAMLK